MVSFGLTGISKHNFEAELIRGAEWGIGGLVVDDDMGVTQLEKWTTGGLVVDDLSMLDSCMPNGRS